MTCPHLLGVALERRPGNALNIEIGTPMPRCRLRIPEEWKGRGDPAWLASRWLLSGGNPLLFGLCTPTCCETLRLIDEQIAEDDRAFGRRAGSREGE